MVIVFLRQNAGPYIKAQVFITGPVLLIVNLLVAKSRQSFFDFTNMTENPSGFLANMLEIYGLAMLIAILSGALLPTVSYSYMKAYQEKALGEIQIRDLTSTIGRKFPTVLGYTILVSIITVIGLFFFLIPGIYLGVVLSLGTAIIMFEDTDPFNAMSRTFKLIKDKWFSTLGILVVTIIISYLINSLFSLPYAVAFGIWTFNSIETASGALDLSDPPAYMQVAEVLFAIFSTFGTIISYSVIYLALAFQYFNLVERQESRGLMAQIQEVGAEDNTSQEEEESY